MQTSRGSLQHFELPSDFFWLSSTARFREPPAVLRVTVTPPPDPASAAQRHAEPERRRNQQSKGFKNGAEGEVDCRRHKRIPEASRSARRRLLSSTELTANITVAWTRTIANFDIAVENSDRRGERGWLFAGAGKGVAMLAAYRCPARHRHQASDTKMLRGDAGMSGHHVRNQWQWS